MLDKLLMALRTAAARVGALRPCAVRWTPAVRRVLSTAPAYDTPKNLVYAEAPSPLQEFRCACDSSLLARGDAHHLAS